MLFAARLAGAGIEVTLLGSWPAGLSALRARGVTLFAADGSSKREPVRVASDPAEVGEVDQAIVLVKSHQTERAAAQLSAILKKDGVALTLQNGLGNDAILARTLGPDRAARGVTTLGAYVRAPGEVQAAGEGRLTLERHPRLDRLVDLLRVAGFGVQVVEDARPAIWAKLVVNAAVNPLTALLGVKNGELWDRPAARELALGLADEAAQVARAAGVALPFDDPAPVLERVLRQTAANRSSMLQDVLRGAPTEIDAINGALVREAERLGLPAALNRTILLLMVAFSGGHGNINAE
jgi:2-dehydropantoate 2-reductase